MQTLYALKQSEISNYYSAEDYIRDVYAPDLNSMEVQDPVKLEEKRRKSTLIFENTLYNTTTQIEDISEDLEKTAREAFNLYNKHVEKDKKYFERQMLDQTEGLYDEYIHILLLLIELADYSINEEAEVQGKRIKEGLKIYNEKKIRENQIIRILKASKPLEDLKVRKKLFWEFDLIKQTYKTALKVDPEFLAYLEAPTSTFEEDKNIILHIIKDIVFKDKNLQGYFEESDLNWGENKKIIKSLVTKTVKAIEDSNESQVMLMEISNNWEEDKLFFKELYNFYINQDKRLEELIADKAKNWDVERIATIDKIILKLATCEMLNFPSVPVKVSINEYIELSKLYSTPKSKQFVNGILDKIASELTNSGAIKKSGRGLIDNK